MSGKFPHVMRGCGKLGIEGSCFRQVGYGSDLVVGCPFRLCNQICKRCILRINFEDMFAVRDDFSASRSSINRMLAREIRGSMASGLRSISRPTVSSASSPLVNSHRISGDKTGQNLFVVFDKKGLCVTSDGIIELPHLGSSCRRI